MMVKYRFNENFPNTYKFQLIQLLNKDRPFTLSNVSI